MTTIQYQSGDGVERTTLDPAFVVAVPLLSMPIPPDYIFPNDALVKLEPIYLKWQAQQPLNLTIESAVATLVTANDCDVEDLYRFLLQSIGEWGYCLLRTRSLPGGVEAFAKYRQAVLSLTGDVYHDMAQQMSCYVVPQFQLLYCFSVMKVGKGVEQTFDQLSIIPCDEYEDPEWTWNGRLIGYGGRYLLDGILQPVDYQPPVAAPLSVLVDATGVTINDRRSELGDGGDATDSWRIGSVSPQGRILFFKTNGANMVVTPTGQVWNSGCRDDPDADRLAFASWVHYERWWSNDESHVLYAKYNERDLYCKTIATGETFARGLGTTQTIEEINDWLFAKEEERWVVSNLFRPVDGVSQSLDSLRFRPLRIEGLDNWHRIVATTANKLLLQLNVPYNGVCSYAVVERVTTRNSDLTLEAILESVVAEN